MSTKELKKVAEELIDVLGLVDVKTVKGKEVKVPITVKEKTDEELIELITEAAGEVQPDDEISDEIRASIDEILNPKKKAVPAKGKKAVVVKDEDEDLEDVVDEDADNDDDEDEEEIEEVPVKKNAKKPAPAPASKGKKSAAKVEEDEDEDQDDEEVEVDVKAKGKKADPAPAAKGKKAINFVKEEKPAKKEKVVKEKKEKGMLRQDAVLAAIKALCKKGATLKAIMEYGDNLYVENGGLTNPTATNVNLYSLQALIAFEVITLKDGIYKFNK